MTHPGRTTAAWRLAAIVTVILAAGGQARGWSVPVTVRSTQPAPVGALPVMGGVPMPQGVLRDTTGIVVRSGGVTTPVQSRILSRWPDGSVRWLLADWQMPLAAGDAARAHLERADDIPASPAKAVRLIRKSDRWIVDTGSARFAIPAEGTVLLRTEAEGADSIVTLEGSLVVDGERREMTAARSLTVVDEGPWRLRIRARGGIGDFQQEIRFDFFAGHRGVRVLHSIESHSRKAYVSLDRLELELRSARPLTDCRFDLEGGSSVRRELADRPIPITQVDPDTLVVEGAVRRARGAGFAACRGEVSHLAAWSRFFWQEYPQGAEFSRNGLAVQLRAPTGRPMPFGSGAAKTHEVWLLLDGNDGDAEALAAIARPAPLWVDPAWTARSGAMRNALAPGAASDAFLTYLAASIERYFVAQAREEWDDSGSIRCSEDDANRRLGAYGMLNWGDWNFREFRDDIKGCDAWGNLEYDTTQVLALAYAAQGRSDVFDAMTASARHFNDVDRIHFSAQHPSWVGMNHPKNPLHFTFELGGVDLGHTWNEGLLSYGVLTGDDRALTGGGAIADYLVRRRNHGMFRGNPRQWGWPQVALVAAWQHSGEERYREAAIWYAHRGMFAHPADGAGDWKRGILAEGLAYTHSVTEDPAILMWLKAYAGRIAEVQPADARWYPALAYTASVVGNAEWRRLAAAKVAQLQFGRWGKPMTIAGRIGFAILALPAQPAD